MLRKFFSEVLQCVKQEKKIVMNLFRSTEDMKRYIYIYIYIYFFFFFFFFFFFVVLQYSWNKGEKKMSEKKKTKYRGVGNWNGILPIFQFES